VRSRLYIALAPRWAAPPRAMHRFALRGQNFPTNNFV
jgi:hypothetical protein